VEKKSHWKENEAWVPKPQNKVQVTKSKMKIKLTKTCKKCTRDFQWRKKWAKDWENVIYCSERCRRRKNK
tara:strand:- start:279 stop:488 length:210 start_codon:yes stop_codon:yes gene_type:complete